MVHTIYYDRTKGTIHGALTLQKYNPETQEVEYIYRRLPARSGSWIGSYSDWINNKSPIPFGNHWMRTKSDPLYMEPIGTPFFPIGTEKNSNIIYGPPGKRRVAIGLHLENKFPGSLGCVVLECHTPILAARAYGLFDYLEELHKTEPFVRFVVL